MFKNLKFFLNKLFSSKYVVRGKCLQCGTCCKNILFYIGNKAVTTEDEFERMKNFEKKYNNFYINGKGKNGELLFACKALKDDGKCSVYGFRSIMCRLYPKISQKFVYNGGEPFDGCGYRFEPDKKFRDYFD